MESLLLFRRALSSPKMCRFIPALSVTGFRASFRTASYCHYRSRTRHHPLPILFLFFGLFRPVEKSNGRWRYARGSRPVHVLFGWLQIASRTTVSAWPHTERWAHYHPHFSRPTDPRNVIYDGLEQLTLPDSRSGRLAGAGVFETISSQRILTRPDSNQPSQWLLPTWFHPEARPSALSYHRNPTLWKRREECVLLSSVARGQEFVLDCHDYPEALDWVHRLFCL
jgi:hypothetical protein